MFSPLTIPWIIIIIIIRSINTVSSSRCWASSRRAYRESDSQMNAWRVIRLASPERIDGGGGAEKVQWPPGDPNPTSSSPLRPSPRHLRPIKTLGPSHCVVPHSGSATFLLVLIWSGARPGGGSAGKEGAGALSSLLRRRGQLGSKRNNGPGGALSPLRLLIFCSSSTGARFAGEFLAHWGSAGFNFSSVVFWLASLCGSSRHAGCLDSPFLSDFTALRLNSSLHAQIIRLPCFLRLCGLICPDVTLWIISSSMKQCSYFWSRSNIGLSGRFPNILTERTYWWCLESQMFSLFTVSISSLWIHISIFCQRLWSNILMLFFLLASMYGWKIIRLCFQVVVLCADSFHLIFPLLMHNMIVVLFFSEPYFQFQNISAFLHFVGTLFIVYKAIHARNESG